MQPVGPLLWPLALEVSAATSLPPSCDSPGEQAAGRKRGARPCSRSPLPVLGPRPMGSRAACPATPFLPSPEQCPPRQRPVGLVPGQRLAGEKRQALGAGRWPGGGQPTQALGHVQPSAVSVVLLVHGHAHLFKYRPQSTDLSRDRSQQTQRNPSHRTPGLRGAASPSLAARTPAGRHVTACLSAGAADGAGRRGPPHHRHRGPLRRLRSGPCTCALIRRGRGAPFPQRALARLSGSSVCWTVAALSSTNCSQGP